jgi:fatty acid desaturase
MTDDIRDVARKRIKARRDFWQMVLVFVIILALCTAVWALGGMGYFWPMWPLFGFAIATMFSALSTFGPGSRPISDQRIDDEVRRLGGGGPAA